MEHLLPHFEYEAGLLSRTLSEFAGRYPKVAARLGIAGGPGDDMHVDRLVQTFALLAARIDSRIDDDYPEFTEALLDIVYPGYLRTIPSCAIACFKPDALFDQLTEPLTIARDTTLDANSAPCRFRTVYDVIVVPVRISSARYAPTTLAPTAVNLPADTTGIVSITFASEAVLQVFDAAIPAKPLRIHLTGERPLVAALTDTLLLRADAAFVEADSSGIWTTLSRVPVDVVGFDTNERLLPEPAANAPYALQTLSEFFAFPELFDFIDIDLARMRRAARNPNAKTLTLHIAVHGTPADSSAAQMLKTLNEKAFRLFCTPVINLFKRPASPIQVTDTDIAYPIVPTPLKTGSPLDIYSVDAVYAGDRTQTDQQTSASNSLDARRTTLLPYRALTHGIRENPSNVYWTAFRDPFSSNASLSPMMLSLVRLDGNPARIQSPQIDIDTTATNGAMPSRMTIGAPDSDLIHESGALSCPIMLLTQPTHPSPPPRGRGALWRVMSAMSPHPIDLSESGLKVLKTFLQLHAPASSRVAQRCVDALTNLDHKPAIRWMSLGDQFPSFVRGIEIFLTFDEAALREITLGVFAKILDRLFSAYAPVNAYVQLILLSAQTGDELLRCTPQPGARPLI